jgi:hypothetical protein
MLPDNERSIEINRHLQAEAQEQKKGVPYYQAIARVVSEFEGLEPTRSGIDLPEEIAYLEDPDNRVILKISKRRPTELTGPEYGYVPNDDFLYGYFGEALTLTDLGEIEHGLTDSGIDLGTYNRIQVADNPKDPYFAAGLTPTQFNNTVMRILMRHRNIPLLGKAAAETGPVAQLFAKHRPKAKGETSIEKEIRNQKEGFFDNEFTQGMDDNLVDPFHLLVTNEGENSPIFQIANALGYKTRTMPFWGRDEYRFDPYEAFKNEHGSYPVLATVDYAALLKTGEPEAISRQWTNVIDRLLRSKEKHPIFASLGIDPTINASQIHRLHNGEYISSTYEQQTLQRFLLKVAVDYSLSKDLRTIAPIVRK